MAGGSTAVAARGPTRANHVCWVYDDVAAFRERAVAFLTEGIAAGNRMEYLARSGLEDARRDLEGLPGFGALIESGDLVLRSLDEKYGVAETVDPGASVAAYAAATRDALARGYTGLRVVAEATPLVRTPAQREAFARYEHLIDQYMVDHPIFAMCAYEAPTLGRAAAAEIACLHPHVSPGATVFRWYATSGGDVGLAGEVDMACWDAFDATLARTMPLLPRPRLVVDAWALEFIDHHGLLTLDQRAQERGTQVVLRTDSRIVHRLASLLELRAVRHAAAS